MIKGCPGAILIKDARPEYIECSHCGEEIEIWSDELMARCPNCHLWTTKERGASCIDWCKSAAECIGLEAYERLKHARPPEDAVGGKSPAV
jgi:Zn finger protein HypA/HybF involved in hydrogenase expression